MYSKRGLALKQGVFGTLFLSLLLITFSLDCYADITGPYKPSTQQVPMAYLSLIGSGNAKSASIDMVKGWSVGAKPYKGSGGRNIARDLKAEDKLELSLYMHLVPPVKLLFHRQSCLA